MILGTMQLRESSRAIILLRIRTWIRLLASMYVPMFPRTMRLSERLHAVVLLGVRTGVRPLACVRVAVDTRALRLGKGFRTIVLSGVRTGEPFEAEVDGVAVLSGAGEGAEVFVASMEVGKGTEV